MALDRSRSGPSFWSIQLGGWSAYTLAVVVTSVPLRHERDYVAFRTAFVMSGFLGSFILYAVCRRVWAKRRGLIASLAWCAPACFLLGFLGAMAAVWAEAEFGGLNRSFSWAVALGGTTGNSFLFLAWAALYFGIKQYQALEYKQLQLARSEASANEAQLRALRYQLQPHFLFNTLNTVSALILDNRGSDARKMVARLGDLLRSVIEAPDTHVVALADELQVVEQYLAIEKMRFGERLKVSIDHAPQTSEARIPRMLLQTLVENAVRHGIAPLPEGGEIFIKSRHDATMLALRIANDCPGDNANATSVARNGVGIANTKSRLRTLYGENQHLEILRRHGGTFEIDIAIPFTTSENACEGDERPSIP
jgi:two-component sensor histidine kinase